MIEKIVVFAIVAAALWYVARRLAWHSKGRGCGNCNCAGDSRKAETLVKIKNLDGDGN